jgi:hypothetical protein
VKPPARQAGSAGFDPQSVHYAQVVELVDALRSERSGREVVQVRLLS